MRRFRIVSEEKTGKLEMLQVYVDGVYLGKVQTLTLLEPEGNSSLLNHFLHGNAHPEVPVQATTLGAQGVNNEGA